MAINGRQEEPRSGESRSDEEHSATLQTLDMIDTDSNVSLADVHSEDTGAFKLRQSTMYD